MGSREEAAGMRGKMLVAAAVLALTVGSAGVAIVPDIAQLSSPFVCSGGHLVTETSSSSLGPGRSGSTTQIIESCVDAAGRRSEVSGFLSMLVIMGELFVPFAAIGWWICGQVWPVREPEADDD